MKIFGKGVVIRRGKKISCVKTRKQLVSLSMNCLNSVVEYCWSLERIDPSPIKAFARKAKWQTTRHDLFFFQKTCVKKIYRTNSKIIDSMDSSPHLMTEKIDITGEERLASTYY